MENVNENRSIFWRLVEKFNMLWFIMALGMGGTSVAGFAFLNYTIKRPEGVKGLMDIELVDKLAPQMGLLYDSISSYLSVHIAVFGILHLLALGAAFLLFFLWRIKFPEKYTEIANNTAQNSIIVAPALAVGMTFNVFLVGGYYYFELIRELMQSIMPIALGFWSLILIYTLSLTIKVQKTTFLKGIDSNSIHFGWLLTPFALAMTAVSGSGIAALAHSAVIAKTAFFLALIPFSMAVFLTITKLVALFKDHYHRGPSKIIEQLPAFFITVPIVTLLSITMFRFGHFFDHQLSGQLPKAYYALITASGWAFMSWYLILGFALLKDYFKEFMFKKDYFDESQWGLICPMVAFAVLGAFVYKTVLTSPIVLSVILIFIVLDVLILLYLATKQIRAIAMRLSTNS